MGWWWVAHGDHATCGEGLAEAVNHGADKAQRLLALTSLGALGQPEALPFLIDWSSEADVEIAAAAKAAVTKIHL